MRAGYLHVAGTHKFTSSVSVRIFIVRTWWMRVRAQTGPRFIALIRRSLGSGVCTTVNSKWLSHFLTQRPKLGSNPWPLDYQSGALTNWAIVPPEFFKIWKKHHWLIAARPQIPIGVKIGPAAWALELPQTDTQTHRHTHRHTDRVPSGTMLIYSVILKWLNIKTMKNWKSYSTLKLD